MVTKTTKQCVTCISSPLSRHLYSSLVCAAALAAASATAQTWSPQRNVEIVVGSVPGGSNDRTARQVEKVILENRLVNATITVVNKAGGGNNIAFNYVNQHAGDAHYLLIGTPTLLTNHITGLGKLHHTDFTPIASLFNDYTVFAYWESVLRSATQVPEWRADLERNYWSDDFVTSAQFKKDLNKDYADMKAVLVDLGLAKQ